jgi:hypothetical protein
MTSTPLPPAPGPMNPDPAPSPDPSPAPPPSEPQPGPMSESPPTLRTVVSAHVIEGATARARERLQRQQTRDVRSFGGRRTGLIKDEAELARMAALEERLLELARRAVHKPL